MRLVALLLLAALAGCAGWTRAGKDESSVAFLNDAEECCYRIIQASNGRTCEDTFDPIKRQMQRYDATDMDAMRSMNRCLRAHGWER